MIDSLNDDCLLLILSYLNIHQVLYTIPLVNRTLYARLYSSSSSSSSLPLKYYFEHLLLNQVTPEPYKTNLKSMLLLGQQQCSSKEFRHAYEYTTKYNYQFLIDTLLKESLSNCVDISSIINNNLPLYINWLINYRGGKDIAFAECNKPEHLFFRIELDQMGQKQYNIGVYRLYGLLTCVKIENNKRINLTIQMIHMELLVPDLSTIDFDFEDDTLFYEQQICSQISGIDEIQCIINRVIRFRAYMFYIPSAFKESLVFKLTSATDTDQWRLVRVFIDEKLKIKLQDELWGQFEITGVIQFEEDHFDKTLIRPLSLVRLSEPEPSFLTSMVQKLLPFTKTNEQYRRVIYIDPSYTHISNNY